MGGIFMTVDSRSGFSPKYLSNYSRSSASTSPASLPSSGSSEGLFSPGAPHPSPESTSPGQDSGFEGHLTSILNRGLAMRNLFHTSAEISSLIVNVERKMDEMRTDTTEWAHVEAKTLEINVVTNQVQNKVNGFYIVVSNQPTLTWKRDLYLNLNRKLNELNEKLEIKNNALEMTFSDYFCKLELLQIDSSLIS
jgi:hypothetical protein